MSIYMLSVFGMVTWGAVFIFLVIALAVDSDIAGRWDEQWALNWEHQAGRPIDDLLEKLTRQIARWRMARRMSFIYLLLGVAVLLAIIAVQYLKAPMSAEGFRMSLLAVGALVGLVFVPLVMACEIGLNLVESIKRHLRTAMGERIIVSSRQEIEEIPKPKKVKKKQAEK